jgi:hypothetical protein
MPYKSESQRKFMHSQLPDIAKKWDMEGNDEADPEKAKKKKIRKKALLVISIGGMSHNKPAPHN